MEPLEREERLRRARARMLILRRRAAGLRRRIVVSALVGFTLLWSVVFSQLITGHDPLLSRTESQSTDRATTKPLATRPSREIQGSEDDEAEGISEPEQAQSEARVEEELLVAEQAEVEQQELEAVTTGQS